MNIRTLTLKCLLFGAVALNLTATISKAQEGEKKDQFAILVHSGRSTIFGNLSKNSDDASHGWDFTLLPADHIGKENAVGGMAGFFILSFTNTSTTVKMDTRWPLAPNKKVRIFETGIVPTFCILAYHPVQTCFGAGPTFASMIGYKNSVEYGSMRTDLRIGHFLNKGLNGGLLVHQYDLDQVRDGHLLRFSMLSYEVGLGWQW